MATILDLERWGDLVKYDPALDSGDQEWRSIHVSPRLYGDFQTKIPALVSEWNLEMSPLEQIDDLMAWFCLGKPLAYGDHFKPLNPIGDGIWELKTADIRMFGWFPVKDCFVGVDADLAGQIKQLGLYRGYYGQAIRFRDALNLDQPKFIPGDDPNDVVSDFYYP